MAEEDLDDLLPLLRGYLAFYRSPQPDERMRELCRALAADPDREGVQLLARDDDGTPVGFATIFWSWSTTRGGRLAVMNDLFVVPQARGRGVADALILACRDRAAAAGVVALEWQTAPDNARAQAVYARVGAQRSQWVDYELALAP